MKKVLAFVLPVVLLCHCVSAKPTHKQTGKLAVKPDTRCKQISDFCLDAKGNVLACDETSKVIRVITPKDRIKATWKLKFRPQAIAYRKDDCVVVAGYGQVALLDSSGSVIAKAALPIPRNKLSRRAKPEAFRKLASVASVACTEKDIYVCSKGSPGYAVCRFDANLKKMKTVVRGIISLNDQVDIAASGDKLYVTWSINCKILRFTSKGKKLGMFGKRSTEDAAGFVGPTNPASICIGPKGYLYTIEAPSGRIKCYTAEGKLKRIIATSKMPDSCIHIPMAINRNGSKIYVLDKSKNVIRVLSSQAGK